MIFLIGWVAFIAVLTTIKNSLGLAFKLPVVKQADKLGGAARGTAVEETHNGVAALDADLSRRDAILVNARDSLKHMATGKTACFHRMLKTLDRFVNADTEPTQQERTGLVSALAEYILSDCAPGSREYDKGCFTQAMRSVKALMPEKEFEKVVERVNVGREPKVKAADFDMEIAARENALKGPERELVREVHPNNV